jgi:hypothetical protein
MIDVDVMLGSQKCQTFVFNHGNEEAVHAPSMGQIFQELGLVS